ncbi:GHMP kinase [Azospirillum sp. B21]|uniref:GHMP family kinase ATP-binding protein n=1 Tax=Azospirillum sp. B21 TaxID=2607496 RepID=UPI001FFE4CDC|nr:GHMP kinase [Azospirillum sp. B21]
MIRARAPLRLGLGGGGTDVSPYCDTFGGSVLNATISMYAYATVGPAPEGKVIFRAVDLGIEEELDASVDIPLEGKLQLHRGVYRRIMHEFNGGEALSLSIITASDVPAGSGLGSSSTMVVAMVEALKERLMLPLGEYEVARLAYWIERHDIGLKGGKQDQYAATFGGINFMEFFPEERVIVNPLRIRSAIMAELEASLILYFTGASRDSARIIEDQSNVIRDGKVGSLEAMHKLKHDAVRIKEHLLNGNIRGVGKVLGESWQAKKQTSNVISNSEIESVYDLAVSAGAYAGKVSGAGGGGFMMFISDATHRPSVLRALSRAGGYVVPCHFTTEGSIAWRI